MACLTRHGRRPRGRGSGRQTQQARVLASTRHVLRYPAISCSVLHVFVVQWFSFHSPSGSVYQHTISVKPFAATTIVFAWVRFFSHLVHGCSYFTLSPCVATCPIEQLMVASVARVAVIHTSKPVAGKNDGVRRSVASPMSATASGFTSFVSLRSPAIFSKMSAQLKRATEGGDEDSGALTPVKIPLVLPLASGGTGSTSRRATTSKVVPTLEDPVVPFEPAGGESLAEAGSFCLSAVGIDVPSPGDDGFSLSG